MSLKKHSAAWHSIELNKTQNWRISSRRFNYAAVISFSTPTTQLTFQTKLKYFSKIDKFFLIFYKKGVKLIFAKRLFIFIKPKINKNEKINFFEHCWCDSIGNDSCIL